MKQNLYAEVHILETASSTPEDRRFDCWTSGDAAVLLDQLAQTVLGAIRASDQAICALRQDLTSRKAIAYAVQIERLVWRWNLSAGNNHADEMVCVRFQNLRI